MNALMKTPIEYFRRRAACFSKSECMSVLRDILQTKRLFGREMSFEQVQDIERKETVINRQLKELGVVTKENRMEFSEYMQRERNRR